MSKQPVYRIGIAMPVAILTLKINLAMFSLLLVSSYILFVCLCLGGVFWRFFTGINVRNPSERIYPIPVPDSYFLGLCLSNVFFTGWSLFAPTNWVASLVLFCLCVVYLVADYRFVSVQVFRPARAFLRKNFHLLVVPLAIALLLNGVVPPRNYDSGLYHLQMIRWIETYKVVPGLGNLHDRFAFNPNFFTLAAGTSFRAVFGQPVFAVNFISLFVFFLWLLQHIVRASRGLNLVVLTFWSAIAFILVHFCFFQLSSPTPDILAVIVSLYVFMRLYQARQEGAPIETLYMVPVLCCWLVTTKLSTLPVCLAGLYVLFRILQDRDPLERILYPKESLAKLISRYGALFFAGSLILIPWLFRNYYLSGYLLYPFPSIDLFQPTWKIPAQEVLKTKEITRLWAIYPGGDLKNMLLHEPEGWPYSRWLSRQPDIVYKALILVAFASPIFLVFQYFQNRRRLLSAGILLPWLIAFVGVVYWFEMAPDIRFGLPYLLICSLLPLWIYARTTNTYGKNATLFFAGKSVPGGAEPTGAVVDDFYKTGTTAHYRLVGRRMLIGAINSLLWVVLLFSSAHCICRFPFYKANSSKVALKDHRLKEFLFNTLPVSCAEVTLQNKKILFDSTRISGKQLTYPVNDERCFDECLPCVINPSLNISFLGPTVEAGIASRESENRERILVKK